MTTLVLNVNQSVAVGTTVQLGTANVSTFTKIRVIARESIGSPSPVNITLTMTEGEDVIGVLKTLRLRPDNITITRVHEVPGTNLKVMASATNPTGVSGSDNVFVTIYGV